MAVGQIISRAIAQGAITADDIGALEITHAKLHTDMDFSSKTLTLPATVRGPATLTIDPAVVGDNTGTLVIAGNLQVDGTTTTINSTTLTVDDKNIVLASGAGNSAAADGAGITIDGASASILYTDATGSLDLNKPVNISGDLTVTSTDTGTTQDPTLILYRNSSSPADNDFIGDILFRGNNDQSQQVSYAQIQAKITDVTDGYEDGFLQFRVMRDGTLDAYGQMAYNNFYVFKKLTMFNTLYMHNGQNIQFEGTTGNDNETTLTVVDPTADRTITFPDATGTVLVQDSNSTVTIDSTDAGSSAGPIIELVRDSASPAAADYLGQIAFKGDDTGGSQRTYAKISSKIVNPTAGSEYGNIEFAVVSNGSNEIVARMTHQGLFINTGNAIQFEGSTADVYETKLEVVDPTADRTITLPDATGTVPLLNVTNTGNFTASGAITANTTINVGAGGGFYLKQDSSESTIRSESQPIVLQTYASSAWQDRVNVTNAGNVGIGTASPKKLLHLYGDENIGGLGLVIQDDGWGAPNGMFMITTRNSDGAFTIRKNTSNAFDFATSTDMLSVRGDGKVGIGTTTPGEKLEVDGVIQIKTAASTHPAMRFMEASDTRGYLGSGDWAINGLADADFGISSGASGKLALGTSAGTARLTLNTDGTILAGYMAGLNHTIPSTPGDGRVIYQQIARFTQNCSATNLDMEGTKWVANKSGSVTMTALMFIDSGSYYFNFKVKNLSNGTYIFNAADGGGYNSYKLQGGNVHADDAYYRWNVSGLRAGDQYVVEMSASSSNGQTLYTNTSQSVHLSNFEVATNDAQIDQSMIYRVKSPYYSSPTPSSSSANGTAVYNAHAMYRNAYVGSHRILLGHFGFRAYAQFMDFRTNLNSNSYMFMFEAHGYFYGAGQMMCSRGGYMYTGNSVINQQDSIPSTNTSCRIYNYYRDSSGFLCGKIQKNHSGYTEGQLYLYWARFGGNDSGMRITAYSQNNTTSNIF